jgi:hypothetical protein
MSDLANKIGATVRNALERQYRAADMKTQAEVMEEELGLGFDAMIGEQIIVAHSFSSEELKRRVSNLTDDAQALSQLSKILSKNPTTKGLLDRKLDADISVAVGSTKQDVETAKELLERVLDTERPSRENPSAARVAYSLAAFFRQHGLRPSASKHGPDPSSIFGKCVRDVFVLLGEKTNWRRVTEAAVRRGPAYDVEVKLLSYAFEATKSAMLDKTETEE